MQGYVLGRLLRQKNQMGWLHGVLAHKGWLLDVMLLPSFFLSICAFYVPLGLVSFCWSCTRLVRSAHVSFSRGTVGTSLAVLCPQLKHDSRQHGSLALSPSDMLPSLAKTISLAHRGKGYVGMFSFVRTATSCQLL